MDQKTDAATSPSSYARFDPHMTLTTIPSSTPDVESVLRNAIKSTQVQVPIQFQSVDVGEKYFMSVYATAQRTPDLMVLRDHIAKKVGEKTVPPIPHMSLFYIDNSDAPEREKMAAQLREEGRVIEREAGSVALDCTEGDERGEDVLSGFVGREIWVMECEGHPKGWKRVGDPIIL